MINHLYWFKGCWTLKPLGAMTMKMKQQKMRILIATAHPDDWENGMGATVLLLTMMGFEVYVVIATLPNLSEMKNKRREESERACQMAGVKKVYFLDLQDGRLEATQDVSTKLARVFHEVHPEVVFTLSAHDVHPDHRAISNLVFGLCLQKGQNIELLTFPVCSSGRGAGVRPQTTKFVPDFYVDTSKFQEGKRALMDCHATQDPAGMWVGMDMMHARRGKEAGFKRAEAFERHTRVGRLHPKLRQLMIVTKFALPHRTGLKFDKKTIGL